MNIDLGLNEIEVLLLALVPRNGQDLGGYFKSAKGKLQRARAELLKGQTPSLFEAAAMNAAAVDLLQETGELS